MQFHSSEKLECSLTSRERVVNALEFKEVDRIPISNGHAKLRDEYPSDVWGPPYVYGKSGLEKGSYGVVGFRTDPWGCVWESLESDVCGEVKYYPLADMNKLDSFKPPYVLLEKADLSLVNEFCHNSDTFNIPMWEAASSPFQRMQFLRGTDTLFMDLAYGEASIYKLRDILHEYYSAQCEMWCKTDIDAVHIEDDWGAQSSLLISPALWREYYKPMYKGYCDIAKSYGKKVLMHSDGFIEEIIPDLIEIGVDAVNAQIFCMDIEKLAKLYHGKIAFWGEIDRQYDLPFGTTDDITRGVDRINNAFFPYGKTGLVYECQWGKDMKFENIEAAYKAFYRK